MLNSNVVGSFLVSVCDFSVFLLLCLCLLEGLYVYEIVDDGRLKRYSIH
jgi:hypothetical protein